MNLIFVLLLALVWYVWFGRLCLIGLVWEVCFGRSVLIGLDWYEFLIFF